MAAAEPQSELGKTISRFQNYRDKREPLFVISVDINASAFP